MKKMKYSVCVCILVSVMGGGVVFAESRLEEDVRFREEVVLSEGERERVAQSLEEEEGETEIFDPLEVGNRIFFDMFMMSYYLVIHPVIGIYNGVVPDVVKARVDDFAGFLRMPVTLVNDVLQGNGMGLQKTAERTAKSVPTLGFYDWERDESPRRYEDYGQTAGVYGVPGGPYIPFPLAPTARDTTMYVAQSLFLDPLSYFVSFPVRMGLLGVRLTSLFSNVDRGLASLYSSVDGYALSRELFLRQRRNAIEMRGNDAEELERRGDDFDLDIDEGLLDDIYEDEDTGG